MLVSIKKAAEMLGIPHYQILSDIEVGLFSGYTMRSGRELMVDPDAIIKRYDEVLEWLAQGGMSFLGGSFKIRR